MSISSFANKKELQFVIALGDGFFEPSDGNITALLNDQITLQGFRASVDIDKAGGNRWALSMLESMV